MPKKAEEEGGKKVAEEQEKKPKVDKEKKKKKKKKVIKLRVYFRTGCFFTDEPVDIVMNGKKFSYMDYIKKSPHHKYTEIKPEDPLFKPNFKEHCIGNMPELTTLLQDEEILEKLQDEETGRMLIEIGTDTTNTFKYLENDVIKFLIKKIIDQIDKVSEETRGQDYIRRDRGIRKQRYEDENWPQHYKNQELDREVTQERGYLDRKAKADAAAAEAAAQEAATKAAGKADRVAAKAKAKVEAEATAKAANKGAQLCPGCQDWH